MTICKACGGPISFGYLEKHVCPKPNAAYEAERDKFRQLDVETRARNERLGIAVVPDPPVAPLWVQLEVFVTDGTMATFIVPRDDFEVANGMLRITPSNREQWAERFSIGTVSRYGFREFPDEATARAAATLKAGNGTTAERPAN